MNPAVIQNPKPAIKTIFCLNVIDQLVDCCPLFITRYRIPANVEKQRPIPRPLRKSESIYFPSTIEDDPVSARMAVIGQTFEFNICVKFKNAALN